jgi:hypothetical protein
MTASRLVILRRFPSTVTYTGSLSASAKSAGRCSQSSALSQIQSIGAANRSSVGHGESTLRANIKKAWIVSRDSTVSPERARGTSPSRSADKASDGLASRDAHQSVRPTWSRSRIIGAEAELSPSVGDDAFDPGREAGRHASRRAPRNGNASGGSPRVRRAELDDLLSMRIL